VSAGASGAPRPELDVVHVDNHLLVVGKPPGLPVVPDESGDESLFDRARSWVEIEFDKPGRAFLGVVHRLDRPVSGVVCFARTSKAAARLTAAFKARRVRKTYLGIGSGVPAGTAGEVVQWIAKDPRSGAIRAARRAFDGAREARSRWRLVAPFELDGRDASLLALEPITGRSHQLRLAAQSLACPLVGDVRHGAAAPLPDRSVALHAWRLELEHPTTKAPLAFERPTPTVGWWRRALDGGRAAALEALRARD